VLVALPESTHSLQYPNGERPFNFTVKLSFNVDSRPPIINGTSVFEQIKHRITVVGLAVAWKRRRFGSFGSFDDFPALGSWIGWVVVLVVPFGTSMGVPEVAGVSCGVVLSLGAAFRRGLGGASGPCLSGFMV
jgi:hypothetical protein